jgi:hypothetical protein
MEGPQHAEPARHGAPSVVHMKQKSSVDAPAHEAAARPWASGDMAVCLREP